MNITENTHHEKLIDKFNRHINYVRISVTDRCDFRCEYCMAEEMTFLPRQQILTLEEFYLLGKAFTEMGVSKIRLTGGEPLIRSNIIWLCEKLAALPGLDELVHQDRVARHGATTEWAEQNGDGLSGTRALGNTESSQAGEQCGAGRIAEFMNWFHANKSSLFRGFDRTWRVPVRSLIEIHSQL